MTESLFLKPSYCSYQMTCNENGLQYSSDHSVFKPTDSARDALAARETLFSTGSRLIHRRHEHRMNDWKSAGANGASWLARQVPNLTGKQSFMYAVRGVEHDVN